MTRAGIPIIPENHPQGLLASAADIVRFLDDEGYADMPVIYDVANAVAIGEDPVEGLRTLWPRLGIVHLSDSPKGQWRHDPIGSGEIDFAAIAGRTEAACLRGRIVPKSCRSCRFRTSGEGAAALQRQGLAFTRES